MVNVGRGGAPALWPIRSWKMLQPSQDDRRRRKQQTMIRKTVRLAAGFTAFSAALFVLVWMAPTADAQTNLIDNGRIQVGLGHYGNMVHTMPPPAAVASPGGSTSPGLRLLTMPGPTGYEGLTRDNEWEHGVGLFVDGSVGIVDQSNNQAPCAGSCAIQATACVANTCTTRADVGTTTSGRLIWTHDWHPHPDAATRSF